MDENHQETGRDAPYLTKRADYEKLYHTAAGVIANIHDQAAEALSKLEELYLEQTTPVPAPEHLKLAGEEASDMNDEKNERE